MVDIKQRGESELQNISMPKGLFIEADDIQRERMIRFRELLPVLIVLVENDQNLVEIS